MNEEQCLAGKLLGKGSEYETSARETKMVIKSGSMYRDLAQEERIYGKEVDEMTHSS